MMPHSGSDSTYPTVQISGTTSHNPETFADNWSTLMIERSGPIHGLIIYSVWLRFMVVLSSDRTCQHFTIFLKQKSPSLQHAKG